MKSAEYVHFFLLKHCVYVTSYRFLQLDRPFRLMLTLHTINSLRRNRCWWIQAPVDVTASDHWSARWTVTSAKARLEASTALQTVARWWRRWCWRRLWCWLWRRLWRWLWRRLWRWCWTWRCCITDVHQHSANHNDGSLPSNIHTNLNCIM